MMTWHVYVEGESDKRFLECLASHMNIDMEIEFRPIEGGLSKLHKVQPQMKRSSDEGNRLGVILDANSDYQQCRNELTKIIGELDPALFMTRVKLSLGRDCGRAQGEQGKTSARAGRIGDFRRWRRGARGDFGRSERVAARAGRTGASERPSRPERRRALVRR